MAQKNKEKMFYNACARILEGNPSAMRMLKKRHEKKSSGDLWQNAFDQISHANRELMRECDPEREWQTLEELHIRLISFDDEDYPASLREIYHPPLALYVTGTLPDRSRQQQMLTVVGTRRGTPTGKATARQFSCALAEAGWIIVSGLALGIDAAAHEGCLDAANPNPGTTIAILARGLDKIYPGENERLGRKILAQGGAIISEYPPGEPPYPNRFLERNRIVSGISRGVLLVEAPRRSGSIATATFAREQNRDLFVVPGPITHPNFFGSHELIRQGAELVMQPENILEAYGMLEKHNHPKTAAAILAVTPEEKQVLIALRDAVTPLEVDKLIIITKLEPRIVNRTLSFLVLKNLIKETEAGYIIE